MNYEKAAREWLAQIRNGNTNDYCFEGLSEALAAADMLPEDIDTSNHELESMWKEGCKVTAHKWLDRMRSGDRGDVSDYTVSVPLMLQKAGSSLADIGSSESEFEQLKRQLPPFQPTPLSVIEEEIDGPGFRPHTLLSLLTKGTA